ncbi:MAG TPA: hypothetical protein VGX25_27950, partial [Actinophytocola sp.]
MPWTVEIHHIYLRSSGDATLVIARHPAVGANPPIARAVLIDAGRAGGGGYVDGYINANAPAIQLHAMVVTHFDEDHYYGIINLLQRPVTPRYHNAIIYDCGSLPVARRTDYYNNPYGVLVPKVSKYQVYLNAIAARPGVRHATAGVNSFYIVQYDGNNFPTLPIAPAVPAVAGFRPPTWLLGKDVLWGNGGSGPPGPVWAETPPAYAPNHPTLRCVVANKWVQQVAGPARFISTVDIFNGPLRMTDAQIARLESAKEQDNAKSLGFLLEFNQFRYYIAGDLERAQEDGLATLHTAPPQPNPGVVAFINRTNDATGRVLAMKTSHHGAATASSRTFLTMLRPSAAFISCGRRNRYWHPFPETTNSLDGYPEHPVGANAADQHPDVPPTPPLPPIRHYLTGYQAAGLTLGGESSQTAGPDGGSIRLLVSEAQSQRDRRGQVFRGVRAAANQISVTAVLGLTPAQLDTIASTAVTHGAVSACSVAAGGTLAHADGAKSAAALAGDGIDMAHAAVAGLVSVGVAAAAGAPPGGAQAAATAAVAALGPGMAAAIGPGTAAAIGATVAGAAGAAITTAAQNAVPPAAGPAATAAGMAGRT